MKLNNQTKLYVSASRKPGNFGVSIYNGLFKSRNINAVYLPRRCEDAQSLLTSIRAIGISGCSISMPLKSKVIPFLESIDQISEITSSVNTIIWNESGLKGFNTDYYGARAVLSRSNVKSILIYGTGSVTQSLIQAAKDSGIQNISITGRNNAHVDTLLTSYKWVLKDDGLSKFDLLINATPASTSRTNMELFSLLDRVQGVFDLVVSFVDTSLIEDAKNKGLWIASGIDMSKFQLQEQFNLYTEQYVEISEIEKIMSETLGICK